MMPEEYRSICRRLDAIENLVFNLTLVVCEYFRAHDIGPPGMERLREEMEKMKGAFK